MIFQSKYHAGTTCPELFVNYLVQAAKEKSVFLQSVGIIQIKSKGAKVVAYTCRYSSGTPNSATATVWSIAI